MLHWHSVQCYEKLFLGTEDITFLCTSRIFKKLQNCWQKLVFKVPCIELDFSTLFAWWASLSGKSAFILISSCVVKEKKSCRHLTLRWFFLKDLLEVTCIPHLMVSSPKIQTAMLYFSVTFKFIVKNSMLLK